MDIDLDRLTARLSRLATHYDVIGQWPEKSLKHLSAAHAWKWVIPKAYGGLEFDARSLLRAYEAVAAGCLSSLLILTQRDGACEFIAACENEELKRELLPKLARNMVITSVGISQLTTSHQGGRPAMSVRADGENFRLRGFMPWVTSAEKCQFVVTGGVIRDGRQILAVLPTDLPGVTIDPPMKLMSLESSLTTEIHCKDVLLERKYVLRGPAERVLSSRSTVKPLVVAVAGIGHAGAMMRVIMAGLSKVEGPLVNLAGELVARFEAVRERVLKFVDVIESPGADVPHTELRIAVNDLLMRLSVAVLTYAKGSGLLRQRDAQRVVREAMFFMVWSAPESVRAGTLARFLQDKVPLERVMNVD